MDFRAGFGSLACRLCAASYQMPIHHLHEPVDVFSEWLDDCEAAAQGRQPNTQEVMPSSSSSSLQANHNNNMLPQYESNSEEDDDNDLPQASGLQLQVASSSSTKKNKSSSAASTKKNDGKGDARPSYTDLGLDDSDDSDDE